MLRELFASLIAAQVVLGTIGLVLFLLFAWESDSGVKTVFPSWWTRRHAAIVTLFLPVTWLLMLPFYAWLVLYMLYRGYRFLWSLATTIKDD